MKQTFHEVVQRDGRSQGEIIRALVSEFIKEFISTNGHPPKKS